jgi:glycosyltransferase involved in cell wall biosynthesis
MSSPIPILFAHHGLDWITGSERCLLDLVQHLDRARFRPVVVCNTKALAGAAANLGATVYSDASYDSPDALLPPRALVERGRRIVRDEKIGLIHANDFNPVKWLMPAARAARIPLLLHVHLQTKEEDRCYSWSHQAAHVVGVSHAAVAGFLQDGHPRERTTVIYNAVDPDRLSRGDARRLRAELGIRSDAVVLVAVGSLVRHKGLDVVLRALAQLHASGHRDLKLLIAGDGPERQPLEALTESLQLNDVVFFLGRRSDVPAILKDAADIAVSGARQEAFPLSVLEAGFFSLPMVASDIPPHREAIDDGRTGLLVPVDDAAAFAAAIEPLINDAVRRRTLGTAASQRVTSQFLIEGYVRGFSDLYGRLLAANPRRYGWLGDWVWPAAYSRWLARSVRARWQSAFVARIPNSEF